VELGLGAILPHADLTADSLAASLHEALAPGVTERARTLAGQVRRDGAEVAARRLVAEYA